MWNPGISSLVFIEDIDTDALVFKVIRNKAKFYKTGRFAQFSHLDLAIQRLKPRGSHYARETYQPGYSRHLLKPTNLCASLLLDSHADTLTLLPSVDWKQVELPGHVKHLHQGALER